jgi:hypothetical protein
LGVVEGARPRPYRLMSCAKTNSRPERVLDMAVVEVECLRGSLNPGPDAHRQCGDEYPIVSWNAALADGVYLIQGANGNSIPSTSARRM